MSAVVITTCSTIGAQQDKKKFVNAEIRYNPSLSNVWEIIKEKLSSSRPNAEPHQAIPLKTLSQKLLAENEQDAIFRLGHSTILIRLNAEYILIDPVFSERASPVQWAGPKRFHEAPISIAELPDIKAVIISHDHYDHLDKNAIKQLKDKVTHFITPLKVGDYLIEWGIPANKVTQLDWWQEVYLDDLKFIATPTQHFSGRSLFDRDQTLWASWVIQNAQRNLFFSGDSGYFSGFKEIGKRFGPFDITMIETGAYNQLWADIHMMPEESLQAHLDLQGKAMLPIHNGTFDLSMHAWFEPLERISELAAKQNVTLLTPAFGEMVSIDNPFNPYPWWREVMAVEETAEMQLEN